MPSPPRGSSILMTSAPRSESTSVAYAPGRRRVRSRTRTPSMGRTAQPAVTESVGEVQHQTDNQPDDESNPRDHRQLEHQVDAHDDRRERNIRDQRSAEWPLASGIDAAQHDDADGHEHEREERADVRQLDNFVDVR